MRRHICSSRNKVTANRHKVQRRRRMDNRRNKVMGSRRKVQRQRRMANRRRRTANRRKVQNHIRGVHAAGMVLLAETATGFCVGMNVPDDKLPLIKTMKVDFQRRAVGGMTAVATLRPEQIALMQQQDKGEVTVPVVITDESGQQPIQAEMIWAWVPKQKKA